MNETFEPAEGYGDATPLADFRPGDRVRVVSTDPADASLLGREMTVVEVAAPIGDENPAMRLVRLRDDIARIETSLFAHRLRRLDAETFYVVHDAEGLRALPVGARLRDTEGDLLVKHEAPEEGVSGFAYHFNGGLAAPTELELFRYHTEDDLDDLADAYGPFELLNPECLDEPVYPTFEVGQRVRIAESAGTFSRVAARELDDAGYVMPEVFGREGVIEAADLGPNLYRIRVEDVDLGGDGTQTVLQYVHADYLTLVEDAPAGDEPEPAEDGPLAEWEKELRALEAELSGIMPGPNEQMPEVPEESGDAGVNYGATASKVTVEQNDLLRLANPGLLRAVLTTLRPGERVKVVDGEVRVFTRDGKADVVYLKPGAIVTVVAVGDNAGGTYLPERTVMVRCGSLEQWVDVTSLHPLTDEQRHRVAEAYVALAEGDTEEATPEDVDEAIAQVEAEELRPGLSSAKGDLEAIEAALPESPVARRAGLIGIAQGIVESMNYEATPTVILEYARFLAGDFDGEE